MNIRGLHIDCEYLNLKTKKEWQLRVWWKIKYHRPLVVTARNIDIHTQENEQGTANAGKESK